MVLDCSIHKMSKQQTSKLCLWEAFWLYEGVADAFKKVPTDIHIEICIYYHVMESHNSYSCKRKGFMERKYHYYLIWVDINLQGGKTGE